MRYFQRGREHDLVMIVEYTGLPGSGKTTLQQTLARPLERFGVTPMHRYELQQKVIQQRISLDRSSWLRRVSSAAYMAQLAIRAMTSSETRLRLTELASPHLIRAAQHCIESQLLYEYIGQQNRGCWCDLDEGVTQHFCSLRVWRRLLKPKQQSISYDWLANHYQRQPHVLVRLTLPSKVAIERLEKRGRPSLWPAEIPTVEILEAYQEELGTIDRLLQNQENMVSQVRIDADLPIEEWSRVAEQVTQTIVSIAGGA